jgi:outer membrane protein insertion porin family
VRLGSRFAALVALLGCVACACACAGAPPPGTNAGARALDVPVASAPPSSASAPTPAPTTTTAPPSARRTPRVVLEGNTEVPSSELLAVMKVDKSDAPDLEGVSNADVLERDILWLNAAYYDRGYIEVKIDPPDLKEATDGPYIDIHIRIHEGARFRIGTLTVVERDDKGREVKPIGAPRRLRDRVRLQTGDFFSRAVLIDDITAVRTLYRDAGYADVEADPETTIDKANATVDVEIPVKRNALTYVDRVVVVGNTRTPTATISKEIEIAAGALFNETKLVRSKKRLQALGLFRDVAVSTAAKPSKTRWTVTFEVMEK